MIHASVFRTVARIAALVLALLVAAESSAGEVFQEYRKRIEESQNLIVQTDEMFGDSVSLYNGSTQFTATDIDLPGNNSLPVQLTRALSVEIYPAGSDNHDPGLGGAGKWSIDVPHISGTFSFQYGWKGLVMGGNISADRCSKRFDPETPGSLMTRHVWQGNAVHVPGESDRRMLRTTDETPQPEDGLPRNWTTRERDAFTCIPALGMDGEGFAMTTAGGLRYDFDFAVFRTASTMELTLPQLGSLRTGRSKIYLLARKITDRFGNTVQYQYRADGLPTRIWSSDGREIMLEYGPQGRLSKALATAGDTPQKRTWEYSYHVGGPTPNMLKGVLLPDGSSWSYTYSNALAPPDDAPWDGGTSSICAQPPAIDADFDIAITHPSGAKGEFSFANLRHYRSGVRLSECLYRDPPGSPGGPYYELMTPNLFDVMSLLNKKISGPGMATKNWTYLYDLEHQGLWGTRVPVGFPCPSCRKEKQTEVAGPGGVTTVHRFGFLYRENDGRLLGTQTFDAEGSLIR